ncbi:MAG: hypothetical protein QME54_00185 [Actinomycetota bacterium]|nr:hypothetical protein [Actinomycetota bacterium]
MSDVIEKLIREVGGRFSSVFGINLESKDSGEIFKWFLASILFGTRIGEGIVFNTYREFERRKVLTPDAILETGWDGLVQILDDGGYVRYDFKTATKLLDIAKMLNEKYQGNLNMLHERAKDPRYLEKSLREFKGVGPVTIDIFLRELREIWEKADPLPQDLAILAARNLGFTKFLGKDEAERARILRCLKGTWEEAKLSRFKFSDFEAALVRLGKDYCRKGKHEECPAKKHCKYCKGQTSKPIFTRKDKS